MRNLLKFAFIMFLGVICCACMNTAAVQQLNSLAVEYMENGDVNAAIARLESSVDLDDKVYESRYNLAVAYMQKKECEKAYNHIQIALELEDNEPAVYYTHAVASMCLADRIWESANKEGEIKKVTFKSKQDKINATEKYIAYLKDANISFDMYTKLAPNVEDTQKVIEQMRNNQEEIEKRTAEIEELE